MRKSIFKKDWYKKSWFKTIIKIFLFIAPIIISVLLSLYFCTNRYFPLAKAGIEKYQIMLADEARDRNDYQNSIEWYEIIAQKNDRYQPYAYLALAEIYSNEITNKNYEKALDYYKKAIEKSNDERIYNSACRFILSQLESYNNSEIDNGYINFYKQENGDFAVTVLNFEYSHSDIFKKTDVCVPFDNDNVLLYFHGSLLIKNYESVPIFDYVKISTNGSLSFENNDEKLVLVDTWSESTSSTSATLKIYFKYNHYTLLNKNNGSISLIDYLKHKIPNNTMIFLTDISK